MLDDLTTTWTGPLALVLGIAALVLFFGDGGVRPSVAAEIQAAEASLARAEPASRADVSEEATPVESPHAKPRPRPLGAGPARCPPTPRPPPHPKRRAGPKFAAAAPPADAPMPPASEGNNGSYTPPASGKKITPENIRALERREEMGLAVSFNSIAIAPQSVPARIKQVIAAANEIVGLPYIWGGGHGAWHASGYDCSGAVSYALAGGRFLSIPLTSVGLESWARQGPGRWITVYANAEHTFAFVDGLRWDTVGDAAGSGPRWHPLLTDTEGFVARHPPGY